MSLSQAPSQINPSNYWRSLSELEGTAEFEQFMHREFPQAASEFPEGVSRRRWMKLMSASLALGGLAGCRYGREEIASHVVRPANSTPGVAKHYATNFELAGRAVHLLVGNVDGRPLKIEGNSLHPLMKSSEPNDLEGGKKSRFASAGTDVFSQACILGLYDPDRAHRVAKRMEGQLREASWVEFSGYAAARLSELSEKQGEGLVILMAPSLSPTVNRLVASAVKKLPKATVVQFQSVDVSGQQSALSKAAGKPAEVLLNLDLAKVICALDCDLLGQDGNAVLYSRQFAKGRQPEPGKMNRLYSLESRYSVTGSAADTRLPVPSSQIGAVIASLESRIKELLDGGHAVAPSAADQPFDKIDSTAKVDRCIEAMAEDLFRHKGAGVVAVGPHQPSEVHLAALRINQKLGNIGKTVLLYPSRSSVDGIAVQDLRNFVDGVNAGRVDTVWVLGGNPAYCAPSDIDLKSTLKKVAHAIYLAEYEDETAELCSWSLPLAHPLESWGDVLAADGGYGICQPQIEPLLGGRSVVEILGVLQGSAESAGQATVRATADLIAGRSLSTRAWNESLHNGFLAGVVAKPIEGSLSLDGAAPTGAVNLDAIEDGKLEVVVYPSDSVYDGRFTNNVWLQELPQVITRLTWDNAALVSPKTASNLRLKQGELVRLIQGDRATSVPVFIVPGQANGSIAIQLGYGRVCQARGEKVGHDINGIRTSKSMSIIADVRAMPTSIPYKLATTQDHFAIDQLGAETIAERSVVLIREGALEQVQDEHYVEHLGPHHPELESLWEEPINKLEQDSTVPYAWGMTIDLNKCIGCNACVVACQSENNVPVVGKEQVARGREMHWLRIDRYFKGDTETPKIVNQPVACVHCETAPCEQVCPVAATVHTEEGINAMAYNRCIGTRYCGNNCPYKVRRFNYFNFNKDVGQHYGWLDLRESANRKLQQLVLNPDVTVRGRGLMEKCTYCIQRVQNGKINARSEGRLVEDGEIKSACQSACPSQAIVFGDLKDPASKVSRLQKDARAYGMLEELNIKPRTLYLARVRNVHQRLKTSDQLAASHSGHDTHTENHSTDSGGAHGEHS